MIAKKEWKTWQSFKNVEELDKHVKFFLDQHKGEISEGNYKVLQFIQRHSLVVPGVSFAKVATISEGAGVSRRTVIRSVNRYEDMGLLEKIETKKPNGKRGVNLLVIQPQSFSLPEDDTPSDTPPDTASKCGDARQDSAGKGNSAPEAYKKQKRILSCKKDVEEPTSGHFDVSYLSSNIPSSFATAAAPFLPLAEIEQGWNKVLQVYGRMSTLEQPIEAYITLLVPVWKQVIYAFKMGRVRSSLLGYFHGALEETFSRQLRREAHGSSDLLFYDWLEEEEEEICV
ncbi:Fic family protein [Salimicrobium halophilum]|uniref:Helix-turn-helix domain-containing protein n=1 Tax=Salimicrobium halophilum TaxID=86666 RepID=A0A1G8RC14_9BACI|nr:hypothetical protein [Salimicrobium halophilum]SDJ14498.1 hypothetical protein SAMN04490247_0946 [Salimicrobium halophilum]